MFRAVKRLAGDVEVTLDVAVDDIERCAEDEHAVHILEDAVVEWTALVSASVKRESAKKAATGKGPLAEIEYWRDRNALSSLYERLNSVEARDMVRVLEVAPHVGGAVVSNYRLAMAELTKLYAEAKDNVKFLTTLERHFKNITHYKAANNGAGTLAVVVDTVAPMINALRMVWIISRHYSDDVRMGGLMVRIADEIGDVVSAEINVSDPASGIFSLPVDVALEKVCLGRTLLETWKSTYMAMREKIELSGRDARWEFDRKQLFDRTDYMAGICADLERMLSVVDGFHKFLGPQLKAVTGEPEAIDAVISRVAAMAAALQNVEFYASTSASSRIGLSSRPTSQARRRPSNDPPRCSSTPLLRSCDPPRTLSICCRASRASSPRAPSGRPWQISSTTSSSSSRARSSRRRRCSTRSTRTLPCFRTNLPSQDPSRGRAGSSVASARR